MLMPEQVRYRNKEPPSGPGNDPLEPYTVMQDNGMSMPVVSAVMLMLSFNNLHSQRSITRDK
jgi:hypothetical protein